MVDIQSATAEIRRGKK